MFVGRAMKPSTTKEYPRPPSDCPHEKYMQAGGGRKGTVKLYWWTCQGCGLRWERVGEEAATDGTQATVAQTPVGKTSLKPRGPPAAPAPTARSVETLVPLTEGEDFEMIPQLAVNPASSST